ncbi:deoxypyrimidine-specific 5' nucleotidase type C protein (NT5C) [Thermodesulfitimonas autotrophica]|uniref:Deoxypyrimidine-specific 5' nucleotidase type C protein (NT5C) n=1 Tax=Thermodesulfitimonas autotrophica TaxID=1894989 RepID=A0A3N5AW92_9THEO|nr:hypothetical protein [Thermodesulfitimonas autotrophica]RPF49486.1 deoxypyrimidine-specific 5' nucleotidase type C protein (NT5C) [Thermodesulfitimonas autotrophica]
MIVVDICNTICDVNGYLKNYADITLDVYPAPIPEKFFRSGEGLRCFLEARPFPGAAHCLRSLADKLGGLVYVTCRPREAEFVTKRWLELHGFPFAPVFFCQGPEDKLRAAKAVGASLALEDDPEAAKLYVQAGIPVLLVDWPYNRHLEIPDVARVKGVADVGYCGA